MLDVGNSFISPGARWDQQLGGRSWKAIGAIAAVAAGTGLIFGEPTENAAFKALTNFNLCNNNDALSRDGDNIKRTENGIVEKLERVQNRIDRKSFVLEKEIRGTGKCSQTGRSKRRTIQTTEVLPRERNDILGPF